MDVEDEDCVHEDAAKDGPEDEELPPIGVRPRPSKEGIDHGGDGLQDAVVSLRKAKINSTSLTSSVLDLQKKA